MNLFVWIRISQKGIPYVSVYPAHWGPCLPWVLAIYEFSDCTQDDDAGPEMPRRKGMAFIFIATIVIFWGILTRFCFFPFVHFCLLQPFASKDVNASWHKNCPTWCFAYKGQIEEHCLASVTPLMREWRCPRSGLAIMASASCLGQLVANRSLICMSFEIEVLTTWVH